MTRLPVIAALLATFSGPALAQPAPAGVARIAILAATVESIDQASRQVVLRGEDDRLVTLELGPQVRNLRRVKPGDLVDMVFAEAIGVRVEPARK